MTDRGRLIVNLTALAGLAVLAAVVALTPEAKDIAEGVREQLRKPSHVEEAHEEAAPAPAPVEKEREEGAGAGSPPPGPHLVLGEDGRYYPESGYSWVDDDPNNYEVVWAPGSRHREYPHVIATEKEGGWRPSPGYDWAGDGVNDLRAEWKPGTPHPDHPHVIASEQREQWHPAPGYAWANPGDPDDFSLVPAESRPPP